MEAGGGGEGTDGLTRSFSRRSVKTRSAVGAQRLLQSQPGVALGHQPGRMDVSRLLPLLLPLLLGGCLPKVSQLYMFAP